MLVPIERLGGQLMWLEYRKDKEQLPGPMQELDDVVICKDNTGSGEY